MSSPTSDSSSNASGDEYVERETPSEPVLTEEEQNTRLEELCRMASEMTRSEAYLRRLFESATLVGISETGQQPFLESPETPFRGDFASEMFDSEAEVRQAVLSIPLSSNSEDSETVEGIVSLSSGSSSEVINLESAVPTPSAESAPARSEVTSAPPPAPQSGSSFIQTSLSTSSPSSPAPQSGSSFIQTSLSTSSPSSPPRQSGSSFIQTSLSTSSPSSPARQSSSSFIQTSRPTSPASPPMQPFEDFQPKIVLGGQYEMRTMALPASGFGNVNDADVDFRVRLLGSTGLIPIDVWDYSHFRYWHYDHYQELRREWLKQRETLSPELRRFAIPHPGVDYKYHHSEYISHSGCIPLTQMSAQCLLPCGSHLSADMDLRRILKHKLTPEPQQRGQLQKTINHLVEMCSLRC